MPEILTVNLGERSYPILFGQHLTAEVHAHVASLIRVGRKIAVLTDANVARHRGGVLHAMFGEAPMEVAAAGEESKSVAGLERVLDFLVASKLDRGGVLFAAGGGVIGDLGGYAAASYLRGIDYFQVPTTLLAMVDSSVGGKTGVNLKGGKNLMGSFHQPRGVFIDTELLSTLPAREFAAGMAEVIKYGLLGDAELFTGLEKRPLTPAHPELTAVIRHCCTIKARIVEADERELATEGGRALLNLGHTFGHAIERVASYGVYVHGEAVAVGLSAAARLSRHLGMVPAGVVGRIEAVLAAHALPARLRAPLPVAELMAVMARDKKARAGLLRFIVLKEIGLAAVQSGVEPDLVEKVWREVGAA